MKKLQACAAIRASLKIPDEASINPQKNGLHQVAPLLVQR